MANKALTLSIVIPVYNEERHLKACLDTISDQTIQPLEVIVVDNNSTDDSARIAKKYKSVKILNEPRQSQVYAQKTGFDFASGDIIGRIDADTRLPKDWVEKVVSYFEKCPEAAGITGSAIPYDIYMKRLGKHIQLFYHSLADIIAGKKMLWGANAAIRRSAWHKISPKVYQRPDIWEDFDISFDLANHGTIKTLSGIEVGLSFRAVQKSFGDQLKYQFRAVRTFWLRAGPLRAFFFTLVWSTELLIYPLAVIDQYILSPYFPRRTSAEGQRD